MVEVGDKAIDFTLLNQDRQPVKLSDYIGKKNIVLVFYLLDFSPVCTNEMCSFDNSLKEFENLDAIVFGISVDSPFSHKALSDFNREVIRKYDVVHEEIFGFKNVGKRAVFIIDKKGIIRYKWVSEDPRKEPNYEEIKKVLSELK
jgi:peroxiredoxin